MILDLAHSILGLVNNQKIYITKTLLPLLLLLFLLLFISI